MHVRSPLRLQYGVKHSERHTYIYIYMHCAQEDRTVWIWVDGRNSRNDDGLLGIPSGTYNRWWREIAIQRVRRRERERMRGKRCVFSTTCRLDWWPSYGQWGECSHRPGSALTHAEDKSLLALYCNNTLPFHSTNCTYHTDQNAHMRICFCTLLAFSVCLPLS